MRPSLLKQSIDETTNLAAGGAAVNMGLEFNTFLEGDKQFHLFTGYPYEDGGSGDMF